MNDLETFNTLKYKRYASVDIVISDCRIDAGSTYWINDAEQLHREDGPAVEELGGSKYWYLNGNLHRAGGPAIEYSEGSKEWYQHGFKHREDGPAAEWHNGIKEWYLNGRHIKYELNRAMSCNY